MIDFARPDDIPRFGDTPSPQWEPSDIAQWLSQQGTGPIEFELGIDESKAIEALGEINTAARASGLNGFNFVFIRQGRVLARPQTKALPSKVDLGVETYGVIVAARLLGRYQAIDAIDACEVAAMALGVTAGDIDAIDCTTLEDIGPGRWWMVSRVGERYVQ